MRILLQRLEQGVDAENYEKTAAPAAPEPEGVGARPQEATEPATETSYYSLIGPKCTGWNNWRNPAAIPPEPSCGERPPSTQPPLI